MTVYKSLKDLEIATYFINPPAADWLTLLVEGAPLRVLASPNPWRVAFLENGKGKIQCLINDRTGATAGWIMTDPTPVPAAALRAVDHAGLTDREVAVGAMAEHLRKPRVWRVPEPKPASELPPPRKRRHSFTPSQLLRDEDPLEMLGKPDRIQIIKHFRHAMKIMCEQGDWDPSLNISGPKIADQLRFLAEKLLHNIEESARFTRIEIERLRREGMDSEVPESQISTLQWKLTGFRVQEAHYRLMQHAFSLEYEGAIGRSGFKNWGKYEGIAERNARSEKEYQLKRRQKGARADMLMHQSEENYERWLATQGAGRKLMPFGPFDEDGEPLDIKKPEESGVDTGDATASLAGQQTVSLEEMAEVEEGQRPDPEEEAPAERIIERPPIRAHEDDRFDQHRRADSVRRTPKGRYWQNGSSVD